MIRVGITDDHEVVRRGIADMLALSTTLEVKGVWCNAYETLEGLRKVPVEVLLLDINLPDLQGDELCKRLVTEHTKLKIIGLSTFDQSVVVKDLIDAGAQGYLTKDAGLADIEAAVQVVLEGGKYLTPNIAARFAKMDEESRSMRLTRREEDILKLISQELTTREIAEKLCVSEKTVESHRAHLLQKLGVRNIAGLVREAILRGFVS